VSDPAPPPGDDRADRIFSCSDADEREGGLAAAKQAIGRGRLVVMPTDTVYGIAADAFDPAGVRRLLRAKGRSRRVPTPVLIASADTLRALATKVTPEARQLSQAFWPGALTIICRQQPTLQWDLGDTRATVAIRVPDHPDALELLAETGPLAVSSANVHGEPPATTIDEAYEQLGEKVAVYLDAGPTTGAVASTIVDATGDALRVVREGVISLEQLREAVPAIETSDG
jgi:L-threonylcarbamoyladenylate synthase